MVKEVTYNLRSVTECTGSPFMRLGVSLPEKGMSGSLIVPNLPWESVVEEYYEFYGERFEFEDSKKRTLITCGVIGGETAELVRLRKDEDNSGTEAEKPTSCERDEYNEEMECRIKELIALRDDHSRFFREVEFDRLKQLEKIKLMHIQKTAGAAPYITLVDGKVVHQPDVGRFEVVMNGYDGESKEGRILVAYVSKHKSAVSNMIKVVNNASTRTINGRRETGEYYVAFKARPIEKEAIYTEEQLLRINPE